MNAVESLNQPPPLLRFSQYISILSIQVWTPQYIIRSYKVLTSWIVIALGKWRNKELLIMMMEVVTFLYLSCHAMIYADVSTHLHSTSVLSVSNPQHA